MDPNGRIEVGDRRVVMSLEPRKEVGAFEWCDNCGKHTQELTRALFYHAPQSDKVEPCNLCGLKRVASPCDGCEDDGREECTPECKESCFYCCDRPMHTTGSYTLCGGCINHAKDAAARDTLSGFCSVLWWNAQA